MAADVSRWEGDQIAIVVGESADAADLGAERLDVEWEDLPVVPDIDAALSGDVMVRPDLHPDSNIYVTYRLRKGVPTAGWEQADVIVEGTYDLPYQEHAYLQPEAAVSWIDDEGRLTVAVAGQWTHEDQEQIAHALDLPAERVRVIYPAIGGAFGGREACRCRPSWPRVVAAGRPRERLLSGPLAADGAALAAVAQRHGRQRHDDLQRHVLAPPNASPIAVR